MALFTAYFDESDTPRAGVLAGCIINDDQFEHFGREWLELLGLYGLSYFHMKDYVHSNGEFASWKGNEQKRREFLKRLIGIVARRANISIGVVMDRQVFKNYVCTPERTEFFKNIYTTASYICLLRVGAWADKHEYRNPIAYVFDDGNLKRSDFVAAYRGSERIPELRERYRLRSLSFSDDKIVPPLQAADFIAYEISKFWTDESNQTLREPRLSLVGVMDAICHDWRSVTTEALAAFAADAGIS